MKFTKSNASIVHLYSRKCIKHLSPGIFIIKNYSNKHLSLYMGWSESLPGSNNGEPYP